MIQKLDSVMLIDDDKITIFLQKNVFEKLAYANKILTYDYANNALEFLKSGIEIPELILLDLNMPEMDGWDFLAQFKKMKLNIIPKIFILTSSISSVDLKRAQSIKEVTGFLSKPLNEDKLSTIMQTHFQH